MKRKLLEQFLLILASLVVTFFIMALVTLSLRYVDIKYMALAQSAISATLFLLPPILYDWFFPQKFRLLKDLSIGFSWRPMVLGVLLLLGGNGLMSYVTDWQPITRALEGWLPSVIERAQSLEEKGRQIYLTLMQFDSIGLTILTLFAMAMIPAITEEFFFRGWIQKYILGSWVSSHAAIWITAVIFSAIHMDIFGFMPRLLLGAIFGYAAWYSGSLWLPILLHALNNATVVIASLLFQKGWIATDPMSDQPAGISALIIGLACLLLAAWLYQKGKLRWAGKVKVKE